MTKNGVANKQIDLFNYSIICLYKQMNVPWRYDVVTATSFLPEQMPSANNNKKYEPKPQQNGVRKIVCHAAGNICTGTPTVEALKAVY